MSLLRALDAAKARVEKQRQLAIEAGAALAEAKKLGLSASIVILTRESKRKADAVSQTVAVIAELEKALKR